MKQEIVECKKSEEELRSSERRFRAVIESANDAIISSDKNGDITFWNRGAEAIFGYKEEEVLGRPLTILMSEKYRYSHRKGMERLNTTGKARVIGETIELNGLRKDGSEFPLELSLSTWKMGKKPFYAAIIRDITNHKLAEEALQKARDELEIRVKERTAELTTANEALKQENAKRNRAEEALRENEERFRQIFEQNEDAVIMFNPDTSEIIDANIAAVELYGYTREELIKEGLSLFIEPAERQKFKQTICEIDKEEGFYIYQEKTNSKKDRRKIIVTIRGKLIRLKESNVVYCSFHDITEKIRVEKNARLMQARLVHANKMTSLGLLVSSVVHEINNPNNFIMFNASLLSDVWQDSFKILEEYYRANGEFSLGGLPYSEMSGLIPRLISGVTDGSHRIKGIVDNLKEFARQDKTGLDGRVDINKVIKDSVSIISSQIKKHTDNFHFDHKENLPDVKGNSQQLEQVTINLIMNSLQALPKKECGIRISTSFDKGSGCVKIQVKDEGVGMSEEVLKRVTEPFFTTRLDNGGTGLGLSISYSIIKDHQGSLKFESEPGKGTIATVNLSIV